MQDNESRKGRQDELWGTAPLKPSHESTMGKIKGSPQTTIKFRNIIPQIKWTNRFSIKWNNVTGES